ncbi:hypothetical protein DOTSEDRAFT_28754 [Dothistroma septosporum NZE10]|uniref:Uncharacterized protein n=1 Tax=Dothistroma septosporum (strain NZE10 / CBS 128990) TaxID=675120 RepID=M2Y2W3_DOTSN|nr:hypothetical protein DOTSEDRAFT_28754 [Dothistroma septosporum NZE10]
MVRRLAAAAALAGGAAAQLTPNAYVSFVATSSASVPEAVSYTTITYSDCPTGAPETMITVTGGTTVTYCPQCEHEQTGGLLPGPTTKKPGHTTTYTTVYQSLCPTGTVPATYTVTESCEEETPTWTPGSDHIPPGFTVTTKHCSACEGGSPETPVPVTITEPCGCEATSGIPVEPKTTPAAPPKATGAPVTQIPDGQIQAPGPSSTPENSCDGTDCGGSGNGSDPPAGSSGGSGSGEGSSPPAGSSAGSGSGGNTPPKPSSEGAVRPPYPTNSPVPQCPGPECNAQATGSVPGGAAATTSPGASGSPDIPAYDGAASSLRTCGVLSMIAGVVGGLAILL